MLGYTGAQYRAGQNGFLMHGFEGGMFAPLDDIQMPVMPALGLSGYIDQPRISNPFGTQDVDAVGDYVPVDTVRGNNEPTMSFTAKLGNATLLRAALRSSALGGYMCLPVLSLVTGATNNCGVAAFSWAMRSSLINSLNFNYQEGSGSPITANVEAMGIAMDPSAPTQTVNRAQLIAAGGAVLTWHHTNWIVGGISFRNILRSARVSVNNNVRREGARLDMGWDNPFSCTNYALIPGQEKLQVSYQLRDKLPNSLYNAAKQSGNWGAIQLVGSNAASAAPDRVRTITVTIANNMLSSMDLDAIQAGQPFGFSASTTSRVISISQT